MTETPYEIEERQQFVITICRMLSGYTAEEYQELITRSSDMQQVHAVMPMIDPTGYRDLLARGAFDSLHIQKQIVEHFVAIRGLIDQQEAIRIKNLGWESPR